MRTLTRIFLMLVLLSTCGQAQAAGTALVVVDMQPKFFERGSHSKTPQNQAKFARLLQKQAEAINAAKAANIPIVFLEYSGHGKTYPALKDLVKGYGNTKTIVKKSYGIFGVYEDGTSPSNSASTAFRNYMDSQNAKTLIFTGINGKSCVAYSIHGALVFGYKPIAYTQGIADLDTNPFSYPYEYGELTLGNDGTFRQVDSLAGLLPSAPRAPAAAKAKDPSCEPGSSGKPGSEVESLAEQMKKIRKKR